MTSFFVALAIAFVVMLAWLLLIGVLKMFGVFTILKEREARVYVLFGNVVGVLQEPGFHFLWPKLGWSALLVNFFGQVSRVDLRLDQEYLRSQPVNSEEGAPMGLGIWYEMQISNPESFLFRNADPRGSLKANVSNTTVRSLSNLKLSDMLENRHLMSRSVREEVSPQSEDWGYSLGSVYVRKVHFRDPGMIKQIEEKVVNRLRQVTSAIRQDGANQVKIITSSAEREAAVEFARAQAIRPKLIGESLQKIYQDTEVGDALFEILENQRLLESEADISVVPKQYPTAVLSELMRGK